MSELPGELTYRMTYAEYAQWIRARTASVGEGARSGRWATAWRWIWYVASLGAWAVASGYAVSVLAGPRWQVPGFIAGLILVSAVSAVSETSGPVSAQARALFEASIYGSADIRLRIDGEAAQIDHAGILYRLPWASVSAIHRSGSIVVIACDLSLGGIAVPVRAAPDPAGFEAALRAQVEAARGRTA